MGKIPAAFHGDLCVPAGRAGGRGNTLESEMLSLFSAPCDSASPPCCSITAGPELASVLLSRSVKDKII